MALEDTIQECLMQTDNRAEIRRMRVYFRQKAQRQTKGRFLVEKAVGMKPLRCDGLSNQRLMRLEFKVQSCMRRD